MLPRLGIFVLQDVPLGLDRTDKGVTVFPVWADGESSQKNFIILRQCLALSSV